MTTVSLAMRDSATMLRRNLRRTLRLDQELHSRDLPATRWGPVVLCRAAASASKEQPTRAAGMVSGA